MNTDDPQHIRRPTGLILGIGLMYLAAYQIFKLPPVLPVLLESYQYHRTLAGGFMSVYAAVGLFLSVPLGRMVARNGPVLVIIISILFMIAGNSAGLTYASSGGAMLLARCLEGIGFAGFAIVGPVMANRCASRAMLPIVISLTAIWIPVGQLIAAGITPFILPHYDWVGLWWIGIGGTVVLGIISIPVLQGMTSNEHVAGTIGRETARSLSPTHRRRLIISASLFTVFSIQYLAFMTWLPQYLVEAQNMTPAESALGYMVPVAIVIPTSLLTGWMLGMGFKPEHLMIAGMILITIVWGLVPVVSQGMWGIVLMIVYGIGAGVTPTCLFAMPSTIVGPDGPTSDAFGIIMTGRSMGVLIGPMLLAWIFTVSGTWAYVAPVFFVTTVIGCGLSLFLYRALKQ